MYCQKCGNKLDNGQKFCNMCGTPNVAVNFDGDKLSSDTKAEPAPKRSKRPILIAASLATVLLGIAIFYGVRAYSADSHSKEIATQYIELLEKYYDLQSVDRESMDATLMSVSGKFNGKDEDRLTLFPQSDVEFQTERHEYFSEKPFPSWIYSTDFEGELIILSQNGTVEPLPIDEQLFASSLSYFGMPNFKLSKLTLDDDDRDFLVVRYYCGEGGYCVTFVVYEYDGDQWSVYRAINGGEGWDDETELLDVEYFVYENGEWRHLDSLSEIDKKLLFD